MKIVVVWCVRQVTMTSIKWSSGSGTPSNATTTRDVCVCCSSWPGRRVFRLKGSRLWEAARGRDGSVLRSGAECPACHGQCTSSMMLSFALLTASVAASVSIYYYYYYYCYHHQHHFMIITQVNVLASTLVKNWRILLEQIFATGMSLLMAASTFGLGRRR